MARLTRTKELWHIPKRGSVHQTVFMVYVLTWDKFLAKSWSSGKQEAMGSEMGKAGVTKNGKAITHQSVRTLLALPKYLGFVYIDESSKPSRIMVTDIGYELIKKHDVANVPKHRNLGKYKESGDLIEASEVFEKQLSKLIITNPSIRKDCQNILVFPFRMTLRLLLELDYLDQEEIAYVLFHTKAEDEYPLVLEKIKTFRGLPPKRRTAEINAYGKTDEGQLTLVKAPTSGYYMYLCASTGLCKRTTVKVNKTQKSQIPAIVLNNSAKAKKIIQRFEHAEIYDFKDDLLLWIDYFSNPNRLYPPHDVTVRTNAKGEVLAIAYDKDGRIITGDSLSIEKPSFPVPAFPAEKYRFIVYDLKSGNEIYNKEVTFTNTDKKISLRVRGKKYEAAANKDTIVKCIKEMFTGKFGGFDKGYHDKLRTIEKVIGINYLDNRRKGGRLEYLFYRLLELLENQNIVDEVFWYGHTAKYGICEPALGGKEGNPDVVFVIDDTVFVLELTTFRGIRAQWSSAEASSVPDHIVKFKTMNPGKRIIGIFSAPSIHPQLKQNLTLNAKREKVGMIFRPCIEFAEFLSATNREELKSTFIKEFENQLGS